MRAHGLRLLPLALALAAPAAAEAAAPADAAWPVSLRLAAGVDWSSGDYGTGDRTDILYAPFSARLEWDRLVLRVTVPLLRVRGSGDVLAGDGGVVVSDRRAGRQTHTGLGDVVLGAGWVFDPIADPLPFLELSGRVKLGTADEDDFLGTGENDYTVQLDAYRSYGRITPFASLGYRFVGDPPDPIPAPPADPDLPDDDLHDTWLASLGLDLRLGERARLGLSWDWREASLRGSGDSHELVPYASIALHERLSLEPYAAIGLSRAAPDYGLGLQLSVRLGRP